MTPIRCWWSGRLYLTEVRLDHFWFLFSRYRSAPSILLHLFVFICLLSCSSSNLLTGISFCFVELFVDVSCFYLFFPHFIFRIVRMVLAFSWFLLVLFLSLSILVALLASKTRTFPRVHLLCYLSWFSQLNFTTGYVNYPHLVHESIFVFQKHCRRLLWITIHNHLLIANLNLGRCLMFGFFSSNSS